VLGSLLGSVILGAVWAPVALAQAPPCDNPDDLEPLDITPAVNSTGVARTAPIFVRYPEGYFEDPLVGADPTTSIRVFEGGDGGPPVPGRVQVIDDTLIFRADEPFEPMTRYRGIAIGFSADLAFEFSTGDVLVDELPPEPAPSLDAPSASDAQSCDGTGRAFRINVSFAPSMDPDGPEGDIEYRLFLTRGPTVSRPRLVARTRNIATEQITMAFLLEQDDVVAPICVVVHAVDGVGNVNDRGEPACFDPIEGNFFEPLCRIAPAGTGGMNAGAGLAVTVAAGAVLGCRRRRPRRRPSAGRRG